MKVKKAIKEIKKHNEAMRVNALNKIKYPPIIIHPDNFNELKERGLI